MPINMMQEFSFENDSVESVEKVLAAVVPVMFKESGTYSELFIRTDSPPYTWRDGKYGRDKRYRDQPRIMQTEEGACFIEPVKTYHGAPVVWKTKTFASLETAAKASCDAVKAKPDPKPSRVFIAMLADYKSDIEPKDIRCGSYQEMIEKASGLLRAFDRKRIKKELGDGYDSFFNHFDGSIGVAYRLHHEPMGGWNKLIISATHAYYGK